MTAKLTTTGVDVRWPLRGVMNLDASDVTELPADISHEPEYVRATGPRGDYATREDAKAGRVIPPERRRSW